MERIVVHIKFKHSLNCDIYLLDRRSAPQRADRFYYILPLIINMITKTFQKKNKYLIAFLILGFLFGGSFAVAPQAQAQTLEELQQMIDDLLEQIAKLNGIQTTKFAYGDTVIATNGLFVRSTPALPKVETEPDNFLAVVSAGAQGKVIDGPQFADGYTWWKIQWERGATGWSAENWLSTVTDNEPDTDNEVEVEILDEDVNERGEGYIEFEIEMMISPNKSDIYLRKTDVFGFDLISEDGSDATDHEQFISMSSLIMADLEEDGPYYVIEKGDREKVKFFVTFKTGREGEYRLHLAFLNYWLDPLGSGLKIKQVDYYTKFETISGTSTSEDDADTNTDSNEAENLSKLTPLGQSLVDNMRTIPTGTFLAHWIDIKTSKLLQPTEKTDLVYFRYSEYGTGKHVGESLGAYWVGKFIAREGKAMRFDLSNPGRSAVKLFIDGEQVSTGYELYTYVPTETREVIIELIYESMWHAGDFAMATNITTDGYHEVERYFEEEISLRNIRNNLIKNPDAKLYVASVYESGDEDSGTVELTLPAGERAVVLLNSYNPVNWQLKGITKEDIVRVFVHSSSGGSQYQADSAVRTFVRDSGDIETIADVVNYLGIEESKISAFAHEYDPKSLALKDSISGIVLGASTSLVTPEAQLNAILVQLETMLNTIQK